MNEMHESILNCRIITNSKSVKIVVQIKNYYLLLKK